MEIGHVRPAETATTIVIVTEIMVGTITGGVMTQTNIAMTGVVDPGTTAMTGSGETSQGAIGSGVARTISAIGAAADGPITANIAIAVGTIARPTASMLTIGATANICRRHGGPRTIES